MTKGKLLVTEFFFENANYKLVGEHGQEIALELNYSDQTYKLVIVSTTVTDKFEASVRRFAQELLKKKSGVNSVAILQEKYSKIFET